MDEPREMPLEAYEKFVGLRLDDLAVACCIIKAPCGGAKAERRLIDRGNGSIKRSVVVDADGVPLGTVTAPANRNDSPLSGKTLDSLEMLGPLPEQVGVHMNRGYDSEATRRTLTVRGMAS